MLEKLHSADFKPYLNQAFRIHLSPKETLEVTLIEVSELGSAPKQQSTLQGRQPFSIVLRAGKEIHLPQRIYPLEHQGLGVLELFLVPIGPDSEGMCYEAVFN